MKSYIIRAVVDPLNPVYYANLDHIARGGGYNRFWSASPLYMHKFPTEAAARVLCEYIAEMGRVKGFRETFQLVECDSVSSLWKTIGVYTFKGALRE